MSTFLGVNFPDFHLERLDGTPFSFSENQGKRQLIFMWASW